jgi:hypothetical protein
MHRCIASNIDSLIRSKVPSMILLCGSHPESLNRHGVCLDGVPISWDMPVVVYSLLPRPFEFQDCLSTEEHR